MDLRAKLKNGTEVDIEIQLQKITAYNERILFYWSKIYNANIRRGDAYEALKKCIIINILDFNLFSHDKMHSVFHITEYELGTRLSDHLELHFLELPKLNRYNESKEDELLVEWAEFLSVRNEMELMEMKSHELSEEIIKAFDELEELSKDPAMREIALNREMALRDYIQRMRDAETEGMEKGMK